MLDFNTNHKISREQAIYSYIFLNYIENNLLESFPNVEVLLRIYLTLMIINCSRERSFSKLKLIKNPLRATMTQNRLNYLTLISIERERCN